MNIKRKLPLVIGGAVLTAVLTATSAFASTGTVTAQTVRVRQAASTESSILKRVYKDEKVEITGEEGDWYKIKSGDVEGYVSKAYLAVSEETVAEPETEPETVVEETVPSEEPTSHEVVLGDTTNQETKAYVVPTFNSVESFSIDSNKKVEVIATLANWSKVKLGSQEGWIPNNVLMATSSEVPQDSTPVQTEEPEEQTSGEKSINQTGYISSNASANFRSEPTTNSTALNKLPRYTEVTVVSELDNGWYKVTYAGKTGYISKSLVTLGKAPEQPSSRNSEQTRSTNTNTTSQSSGSSQVVTGAAPSSHAGGVVGTAQSLLGSRYTYGGNSPSSGFDCSGFTSYVYAQNGVSLNRTAAGQLSNGVAISKSELQPGDLVMFGNSAGSVYHVGIYVGGGQMIHAANSNRGVVYDTINSGYYANNYYGARRVQ